MILSKLATAPKCYPVPSCLWLFYTLREPLEKNSLSGGISFWRYRLHLYFILMSFILHIFSTNTIVLILVHQWMVECTQLYASIYLPCSLFNSILGKMGFAKTPKICLEQSANSRLVQQWSLSFSNLTFSKPFDKPFYAVNRCADVQNVKFFKSFFFSFPASSSFFNHFELMFFVGVPCSHWYSS